MYFPCQYPPFSLGDPLVITSIFIFALGLLQILVCFCRSAENISKIRITYLIGLLLWMVAFAIFTGFLISVTKADEGNAVSGISFKEYHLGSYSNWLQKFYVNDKNKWNKIKSCLIHSHVCSSLTKDRDQTALDFYKKNLSSIHSGCCKPPIKCGFEHQNATFWTVPKSGAALQDGDCFAWRNQQERLYYNCNSCKAGVLADMRTVQRMLAFLRPPRLDCYWFNSK